MGATDATRQGISSHSIYCNLSKGPWLGARKVNAPLYIPLFNLNLICSKRLK